MTFEEDDAVDQPVGVMHLLDQFLPLLLGEARETPVLGQPIVQPVLVDGAELELQRLVQAVDDPLVAFHELSSHGACGRLRF